MMAKKKKKKNKKKNPIAKALSHPLFKHRIVPNKNAKKAPPEIKEWD